jgi:hypothetical protein
VAVLADFGDNKGGSQSVFFRQFVTLKLNRFIAVTGGVVANRAEPSKPLIFKTGNAPAVASDGSIVAKVKLAAGKQTLKAILAQGAGGANEVVALQGQPAPGKSTETDGNWLSFSDPVIAPDGTYAFAAKVTGPAAKASGLWTNLTDELRPVLRQGMPVPGLNPPANLRSILSYSMLNNRLFVLLKVAGPAASDTVLLGITDITPGVALLRTGQGGLMLDGSPTR